METRIIATQQHGGEDDRTVRIEIDRQLSVFDAAAAEEIAALDRQQNLDAINQKWENLYFTGSLSSNDCSLNLFDGQSGHDLLCQIKDRVFTAIVAEQVEREAAAAALRDQLAQQSIFMS